MTTREPERAESPQSWPSHAWATVVLALPLIGAQLAQMAMGVTDTVMIGWLGAPELAGSVLGTQLDPKSYRALVRFSVAPNVELSRDSSAAIVSASLLGGKYLSLMPGGDVDLLKNGDEITLTQSSINLEELVGKYIFGTGTGNQPAQVGPQ